MIKSISLEWAKYKKNRVFIWMNIAYVVFLPSMIFKGKFMDEMPPPLPSPNIIFEFPTVWDFLGYSGNWLVFFFFGFLGVYFITNEVAHRTLRQNIITGISRKNYFKGKFLFIIIISIVATVYFSIAALMIGGFNTEGFTISMAFDNEWMIFRYFLMVLSYMSFGMLIGLIFRKTGLALLTYFSYVIFLEPIWRWLVHSRLIDGRTSLFYPMNVVEDLAPFPFFKLIPDFMSEMQANVGFELLSPTEAIIGSIIWLCIFLGSGYYIFQKKDL